MTTRQQQVVKIWLEQGSVKEAAKALKLSPKTIEFHLSEARKQLNIGPLIWLAAWAVNQGIADMKHITSTIVLSIGLLTCSAGAQLVPTNPPPSVQLAWTKSVAVSVTNYFVYYGAAHAAYTNKVAVGNVAQATLTFPQSARGNPLFFAVTSQAKGLESVFSNEVSATPDAIPDAPNVSGATVLSSTTLFILPGSFGDELYQLRMELSPVLATH